MLGVAQHGFGRLLLELDSSLDRTPDAFFALVGLGPAYLRFAFDQPSLFRFMYVTVPVRDDPLHAEHNGVLAR
ncbi:MAG: hypothetical protein H3C62_16345, partial [Gemmatimonadaceae bacterium]|nr:hypothetical protein [Gemmatimonadaceae bacterium]